MSEQPATYTVKRVRTQLDWAIDDACTRMRGATTPEGKLLWARRMNAFRRERGDFARITEGKQESASE